MEPSDTERREFETFSGGYRANIAPTGIHSYRGTAPVQNRAASGQYSGGIPSLGLPHDKSVLEIIRSDAARHKKTLYMAAAGLLAVSSLFFFSYMKAAILLAAFTGLGAVSRMWQRFLPISFGVELVMLSTVISAMLYGPFAGLAVGFLSLVLSTLMTQEDIGKMWPAFLTIALVGFVAGSVKIANIALWGVGLTVLYDMIISIIYISQGHSIAKTFIFDATHIAFNYFVFFNVAPALLSVLA